MARRKAAKVRWSDTPAGNAKYHERRAEAQRRANETGFDHGIEANDIFHDYIIHMLPRRENRYGFELRCEVVCPEVNAQPGHGPASR